MPLPEGLEFVTPEDPRYPALVAQEKEVAQMQPTTIEPARAVVESIQHSDKAIKRAQQRVLRVVADDLSTTEAFDSLVERQGRRRARRARADRTPEDQTATTGSTVSTSVSVVNLEVKGDFGPARPALPTPHKEHLLVILAEPAKSSIKPSGVSKLSAERRP